MAKEINETLENKRYVHVLPYPFTETDRKKLMDKSSSDKRCLKEVITLLKKLHRAIVENAELKKREGLKVLEDAKPCDKVIQVETFLWKLLREMIEIEIPLHFSPKETIEQYVNVRLTYLDTIRSLVADLGNFREDALQGFLTAANFMRSLITLKNKYYSLMHLDNSITKIRESQTCVMYSAMDFDGKAAQKVEKAGIGSMKLWRKIHKLCLCDFLKNCNSVCARCRIKEISVTRNFVILDCCSHVLCEECAWILSSTEKKNWSCPSCAKKVTAWTTHRVLLSHYKNLSFQIRFQKAMKQAKECLPSEDTVHILLFAGVVALAMYITRPPYINL